MKLKNFDHLNCPVAATLSAIGEHWTMLIVRDAFFGIKRFEDFRKDLGIARNMLSSRLKRLVEEGILKKIRGEKGYYEYHLSKQGLALQPVLLAMAHWGDRYRPNEKGARIIFVDRKLGEPIQEMAVRSSQGRPLGPRDIRATTGPGFYSDVQDVPLSTGASHEQSNTKANTEPS